MGRGGVKGKIPRRGEGVGLDEVGASVKADAQQHKEKRGRMAMTGDDGWGRVGAGFCGITVTPKKI